jgi:hypothetical protein
MDSFVPVPDQPDAASPEAAAAARDKLLVGRLDRLGVLAMELAEETQVLAMRAARRDLAAMDAAPADGPALPAESNGPTLSFARAARVARDCIAMERKITAPAQAGRDADARRPSPAARRRLNAMKDEVRHHVECSIRSHAEPRHVDRLLLDLDDRLDDPDVEAEFGTLTVGQMVLSVCRDLEVKVDLTSWPEETLNTARTAATNGRWQPPAPPAPSNGMARGMAADPSIEKLPTGVIGSPGVPPAIDLPPWSHPNPPQSYPSRPPPPPSPQPHPSQPAPRDPRQDGHAGHDPPAAPRRPPGSFFAR